MLTYGIKKNESTPFYFWLKRNGYKVEVMDSNTYHILLSGTWHEVPLYGRVSSYVCAILHKAKKEMNV